MERQRTLTIKLSPDDKTWRRLRELGWQSDQYRNHFAFALTAQAAGLCVDPEKGETNDVTKHIRRFEKGELSGAAYSSAEREVSGFFSRKESTATGKQVSERIKVLAGKALPQWRGGALSIRGHKNKAESGVRLEVEKGNFIIHLQAQAHTCEGGSWIKVVVAGGVEIRDWQAPLLRQMVTWDVPIRKAIVTFKPRKGKTLLRLSYHFDIPIPEVGERVATLGPSNGLRLFLRTETQSFEYSQKLFLMKDHKDKWDAIRRRMMAQIGSRKGKARAKRKKLALISTKDWFRTFLHQWSREIVEVCREQGVGKIVVAPIANLDWPAFQFVQYLKYKAGDYGMSVVGSVEASMEDASTKRAVKHEVRRETAKAKRQVDAVRTLRHEIGGRS